VFVQYIILLDKADDG